MTNYTKNLIRILLSLFICQTGFSQYETLRTSYDLLSTVAGKGDADNGGENGWQVSYEGGLATAAELSRPHMAMADSAGNIYIADKDAEAIRRVNTDGTLITVAGTSTAGDGGEGLATEQALNAPNGVWVNKAGEFYILDMNNNKIRKVDLDGNMTTVVDDPSGISLGRGLWLNDEEDTIWYSSGSQVKMWTEAGGVVTYASGFSGLGNIVQDANGFLVATDRTANRVYRVDSQGNREIIAGNGSSVGGGDGISALETAFDGVRGVWFLEDNSYFLGTHEGSQIWYIDTEGIAHLFLNGREGDEYYSGDGQNYQTPGFKISEVRSVSVDYQGNVIITENDRGFIRKVSKAGVDALLDRFTDSESGLLVYPNPATDELHVRNNSEIVEVYDISGYQVIQTNESVINVSCLKKGVYFIRIGASQQKFIKN